MLEDKVLKTQHGFMPGRGTLTAWREIIMKVLKAKWIYECDLVKFFDSIQITEVTKRLEKWGVPKQIVYYLENLNRNTPLLQEVDLMDESQHRDKNAVYSWKSSGGTSEVLRRTVEAFVKDNGEDMIKILMEDSGCTSVEEYVQLQWALLDQFEPTQVGPMFKGMPQGAPTSPFLSILTLDNFLTQQDSISYADDPIFYGDKEFKIKDFPYEGIVINEEKSRWIKRDGEWLEPLKYLGLLYDPTKKTLKGATRKGAKSYLPKEFEKLWREMQYKDEDNYLEDMGKRNIFGYVIAQLYGDGWWKKLPTNIKLATLLDVNKKSLLGIYSNNLSHHQAAIEMLSGAVTRILRNKIRLVGWDEKKREKEKKRQRKTLTKYLIKNKPTANMKI